MEENSTQGHRYGGGETVRSRWTPKPEQILILESIFNSGMVNPPKDETVRIRKLLEKFGSVGDANVFYWFQNRRSRSRRRQRQLQASLAAAASSSRTVDAQATSAMVFFSNDSYPHQTFGGAIQLEGTFPGSMNNNNNNNITNINTSHAAALTPTSPPPPPPSSTYNYFPTGGGFEEAVGGGGLLTTPSDIIMSSSSSAPETFNFLYQGGGGGGGQAAAGGFMITVFINGVATEVGRGPVDVRSMFGEDVALLHSSGLSLPVNEFGFLLHGLQHGESYFLVSRQA